jgi:shikimate dehydrogenase
VPPDRITGDTRIFLQVAHPGGHVRAPESFNALLRERSVDALMLTADVAPAELPALVTGVRGWRNLCGLGVTMPHKESMAGLVDALDETAADSMAVNVVRRDPDGTLTGAMFDGTGYLAGLRAEGHEVTGRRVTVVGAGGAGRAIAFALARGGAARLRVVNRTRARAEDLAAAVAERTGLADTGSAAAPGPDDEIVVNATSLGMSPADPLPFDPARLAPGALVAEAVMNPDVTALLTAAAARGLPTHRGHHMLAHQLRETARFLNLF